MDLRPGLMVNASVRLDAPLGGGGMGSVWVGSHLTLHTRVVVKFLSEDLVNDEEAVQRFTREATAAAQIKSPHVVQVFDHGIVPSGQPYIVMELLEGQDLRERLIARGPLPIAEVSSVLSQVAKAMGRMHERGIVHRDIKPANIFLCDVGGDEHFVKLLDFGIAKRSDPSLAAANTNTGSVIVGTPYYMSPEQISGHKHLDLRTDLWSLGVVAFEALTARRPFDHETVGALAVAIHNEPLPMPSHHRPDVPAAVDEWFTKACCRDPRGRFASARQMADAFEGAIHGIPWVSAATTGPTAAVRAVTSTPPSHPSDPGQGALDETLPATAGSGPQVWLPQRRPPSAETGPGVETGNRSVLRRPKGVVAASLGAASLFGFFAMVAVGMKSGAPGRAGPVAAASATTPGVSAGAQAPSPADATVRAPPPPVATPSSAPSKEPRARGGGTAPEASASPGAAPSAAGAPPTERKAPAPRVRPAPPPRAASAAAPPPRPPRSATDDDIK